MKFKTTLIFFIALISGFWFYFGEKEVINNINPLIVENKTYFYLVLYTTIYFFIFYVRPPNSQIKKALKNKGFHNTTWEEFEKLTQEVFKKRGYRSELIGGSGGDGGADVIIKKGRKTWVVQCKHWKNKVGVSIVREMYGVGMHMKTTGVKIVTSGEFTSGCYEFAKGKEIELINGKDLLEMSR